MIDLTKYLPREIGALFNTQDLETAIKGHLEELKEHYIEVFPKIKRTLEEVIIEVSKLLTETKPEQRTRILRRIGSLKCAHLKYMKAVEKRAAWVVAESIWSTVENLKGFLLGLVGLFGSMAVPAEPTPQPTS